MLPPDDGSLGVAVCLRQAERHSRSPPATGADGYDASEPGATPGVTHFKSTRSRPCGERNHPAQRHQSPRSLRVGSNRSAGVCAGRPQRGTGGIRPSPDSGLSFSWSAAHRRKQASGNGSNPGVTAASLDVGVGTVPACSSERRAGRSSSQGHPRGDARRWKDRHFEDAREARPSRGIGRGSRT